MNTHQRMDFLSAEIDRLETALVHREQEAFDLSGDEDECQAAIALATEARAELGELYRMYRKEAEAFRKGTCHVHGRHALIVTCRTCVAAWTARDPALRPERAA